MNVFVNGESTIQLSSSLVIITCIVENKMFSRRNVLKSFSKNSVLKIGVHGD